ncbi:MAG: ribosomal protein S18-alanine N-acetyltransferase [Candidatus Thermoplasmatota archaeon]|nr:ribosomal protein S18-alanine N-acetyltransferase [Candidatus Thermoplasmatota archaeon]
MLPPVQFRPFEEDDLYEVLRLANETLDESYEGGLFLHFARLYPEGFIVATEGEEIIGFVLGTIQRAYEARILALAVKPSWRRKGIATQLTERFLERFARFGVRRVTLEVRVSNEPAIGLYQRMGFEKKGMLERYYGDGEDAYVMALTLG